MDDDDDDVSEIELMLTSKVVQMQRTEKPLMYSFLVQCFNDRFIDKRTVIPILEKLNKIECRDDYLNRNWSPVVIVIDNVLQFPTVPITLSCMTCHFLEDVSNQLTFSADRIILPSSSVIWIFDSTFDELEFLSPISSVIK
ncbi:hypothetical protein T03_1370, partial [Trichinella britovi]